MKKIFKLISFVAIATLIFSGCNKENIVNEQQDVVLNFNIETNNRGDNTDSTKAYKAGWENGDKLYLLFGALSEDGDVVFTPEDYIILTYNSQTAKWNVTRGQNVLNNITEESGYVDVGFCDGTPTADGEDLVFSNAGEKLFLLHQGAIYVKTGNVITISEENTGNTVILSSGMVQFNVKIPYAAYSKVVMENFYRTGVWGDVVEASGYSDIIFNRDGIRKIKKMGVGNYPAQKTSDEDEIAFFFQPNNWNYTDADAGGIRIKLIITIGEVDYTIRKDFTKLILSKDHCYSIKGPTGDIATAAKDADLGNGWVKM